jgi:hypothetical protein
MKKYLYVIFMLFSVQSFAQITLDISKPGKSLIPVSISATEKKYLCVDWDTVFQNNYFFLFNPDGSTYKQVYLPAKPPYAQQLEGIYYVSLNLFDTDSTTLEYLVVYSCDSIANGDNLYDRIRIVREDGTILLDQYYAFLMEQQFNSLTSSLFQINNQSKLILWYLNPLDQVLGTKIFNLPGKLPNDINPLNIYDHSPVTVYPNPNNGNFYIKIKSAENDTYILQLFSNDGKLISTFTSSENPMYFSNTHIPDGIYYLKILQKGDKMNESKILINK